MMRLFVCTDCGNHPDSRTVLSLKLLDLLVEMPEHHSLHRYCGRTDCRAAEQR